MDDPIYDIELEDCPICRGAGLIQDEQGWSVSVACMDCGAETAHAEYRTPEERLEAALVQAAWSAGRFQDIVTQHTTSFLRGGKTVLGD